MTALRLFSVNGGTQCHRKFLFSLQDLTMETDLEAVNGRKVRAIEVFAHALRFFREHALKVRPRDAAQRSKSRGAAVTGGCVAGGEGPVVVGVGGRGNQMGDHCPGCVETTCQAVYERGCVPGRTETKKHISYTSLVLSGQACSLP